MLTTSKLGAYIVPMNQPTPATEAAHLCGHLPLRETADTTTTFCPKCVAWDCTTENCPGHMRFPGQTAY
jgi:hypothetical protein